MDCLSGTNLLKHADFSRKVLLVGDIKLDITKTCTCSRIAAEAPIPIYYESDSTSKIGGAAHVVKNLHSMGIDVDLVSFNDTSNKALQQCMKHETFRTDHILALEEYDVEVTTKYVTSGCQTFESIKPAVVRNTRSVDELLLKKVTYLITTNTYAAVILMYTTQCTVSKTTMEEIIKLANHFKTLSIVSVNEWDNILFLEASIIVAKQKYFMNRFDTETVNDENEYVAMLKDSQRINTLILLSETSISYYQLGQECNNCGSFALPNYIPMARLTAVNNAILASIVLGTAYELPVHMKCAFAVKCAANVCKKNGDMVVNFTEVLPCNIVRYKEELTNYVALLPKNKKVVVTTGCFDLLHAGHVESLRLAKELGDVLIVLLNSDTSVKELKGPTRPIYPQEQRISLLQSVKYVDLIVLFDDKEPHWQLKTIDPHVFVKGGEYSENKITKQFPYLKQYKAVQMVQNIHTTSIIQNIIRKN